MGIIMGALGGAGDFLAGAMQQRVKTLDAMDLDTHRSELETQKAKALADYNAVLQDNARQASVSRIDAARTGIIGKAIDSQYAGATPSDPSTWTPEQQAAVDQSKGIDTAKMQNDPEITAKAAISTGDLSARDAITLAREDRRDARDDQRHGEANRRLDIQQKFNEDRAKYQDKLAAIAEARANRMEGRQSTQMEKAELQSTRQALSSVLKDIGTQEDKLQTRLADPMLDPAQKAVLAKQMATLDADRISTRNHLLELAGVETPKAAPTQEPAVKYDAQGRAYVKGPDGKPMLKSDAEAKPNTPASTPAAPPTEPSQSRFFGAGGAKDPMFEHEEGPHATASPQAQALFDSVGSDPAKAALLRSDIRKFNLLTPTQRKQIMQLATTGG